MMTEAKEKAPLRLNPDQVGESGEGMGERLSEAPSAIDASASPLARVQRDAAGLVGLQEAAKRAALGSDTLAEAVRGAKLGVNFAALKGVASEMLAQSTITPDLAKIHGFDAETLKRAAGTLAATTVDLGAMRKALEPYDMKDLAQRMGTLAGGVGLGPNLSNAAKEIAEQARIMDAMRARPREFEVHPLPSIDLPPNPIHETNERLSRIEERFEHISEVAESSTRVAVSLQAAAFEFLAEFRSAAADTNKSGSKAIMVGWLALAIAIVTGVAQIAAPLFLPDQEAEALRQSVVDLQGEIAAMRTEQATSGEKVLDAFAVTRKEQAASADKLIDALAQGDAATAAAVREVLRENSQKAEVQK